MSVMTVYVDDMFAPYQRGRFLYKMCHMVADTLDELHEMAERIGVRRSYFQHPPKASAPHYDITTSKRLLAIRYGAREIEYGRALIPYSNRLMVQWLIRQNRLDLLAEDSKWLELKSKLDPEIREYVRDLLARNTSALAPSTPKAML